MAAAVVGGAVFEVRGASLFNKVLGPGLQDPLAFVQAQMIFRSIRLLVMLLSPQTPDVRKVPCNAMHAALAICEGVPGSKNMKKRLEVQSALMCPSHTLVYSMVVESSQQTKTVFVKM